MRLKSISPCFSSFVSASAGTGKTKTLIDRLLNLLLNGVKPNKILCLTFTKAAASEILTRIDQKLSQFCICDRETLLKELTNLGFKDITPELENKARILFAEFIDAAEPLNVQTIHAFCQELLTKFPSESGVNLNFTLLDNNKIIELIEKSKQILLSSINEYPQLEAALKYLSWHLKEYSLNELLKEIISNREKLDHFFRVNEDINLEMSDDETEVISEFINAIPFRADHFDIFNNGGKSDISRAELITKFMAYPLDLQVMMISQYFSCFLTKSGAPLKSLMNKKLAEEYPDLQKRLFDEQQRVYQFRKTYNALKTSNLTRGFIILSYYMRQVYQQLKQQNNGLDYSDLISLSSDLLGNSEYADWIRYKLDGGIDHILVDEAQDNSPNQWTIINKITEEFFQQEDKNKSLFIVGDAKQSIFKFQGAAPEIFNAMDEYLPEEIVRVQLNTSFRSGRAILRLVDSVFNQDYIKTLVSDIEKNIKHIAYRDFEGSAEIWPLILEPEAEEEKAWQLPSDYNFQDNQNGDELLAKKIAENIGKWFKCKKFIHSKNRIINPGDVLILTRRRNSFVHALIKTLRQENIPVVGLDRIKLLEHPAILDIVALSDFILCYADDMNLAIVLKSPIFGVSEEQLLHSCYNRNGTLWESIKEQSEYKDICSFIEELNPRFLLEFYFDLIESKGLRKKLVAHFGEEVNEILDVFLDIVEKFENEENSSLQLFINFLSSSAIEVQRDLSQVSEQVRIMTIHGAKGLQAPIVILADTISLPHNDDSIIWCSDKELLWPGKAKYYSDIAIQAKAMNAAQEYAEYLRLLYVALTRAEDEIIVTGVSKSEKISEKCWYSIVNGAF